MLDLVFIGLTILFFLIALAYVRACEKSAIGAVMNLETVASLVVFGAPAYLFDLRAFTAGEVLMTFNGWFQIVLFIAIIVAIAKPVGIFMTHVFNGERTFMHPVYPSTRACHLSTDGR